tara:strand:- start:23281 stop:23559 length:279 start_codon:yes stop_codon:yes gene_type:complete
VVRLTDFDIGLVRRLELFPLDGALRAWLQDFVQIAVKSVIRARSVLGGIVFPRFDSALDALIVEVGVVFLLEALEHSFQLVDTCLCTVALAS